MVGVTSTVEANNELGGYSIIANIPDNQINKEVTYFDLLMKPDQRQEISIRLTNNQATELVLKVSPNDAQTNQNVEIDYSQTDDNRDSSLKVPFRSVVSEEQTVTLAPNETRAVVFTLQMPKEPFQGTILGGFYITNETKKTEEKKADSQGVQLETKISHTIGVKLREKKDEIAPELQLNEVEPTLVNYRTAVLVDLQNRTPTIISGMKTHAEIRKKGSEEVLHEATKERGSMAPNSTLQFPIMWDNQRIEPGEYRLKMLVTYQGREWPFEKDFTIKAGKAKALNEEAVELPEKQQQSPYLMMVVVVLAVVLVGLIIYLIIDRRKRHLQEAQRKQKGKKKKM